MSLNSETPSSHGLLEEAELVDIFNKGLTYPVRPVLLNFELKYKLLSTNPSPDCFHLMIDDNLSRFMLSNITSASLKVKNQIQNFGVNPFSLSFLKNNEHLPVAYVRSLKMNNVIPVRAEVNSVDENRSNKNGNVNITYIDTGKEEWVSHKQLYPPSIEFLRYPRLALPCRLSQVVPPTDLGWPSVNYEGIFTGKISQKFIPVVIVRGFFEVYLEVDDIDVGLQLVNVLSLAYYSPMELMDKTSIGKDNCPGQYPRYDLANRIGTKIPVYGLKFVGDFEAYIQTSVDETHKVWEVVEKYKTELNNKTKEHFPKERGSAVLVKMLNDYYRGTIVNEAGPEKYTVKLVDYCETNIYPENSLFKVPEELLRMPETSNICYIGELMRTKINDEQKDKVQALISYKDLYARIMVSNFQSSSSNESIRPIVSLYIPEGGFNGKDTPLSKILKIPAIDWGQSYVQRFVPVGQAVGLALFDGPSDNFITNKDSTSAVFSYAESERSIWLQIGSDAERATHLSQELNEFYNDWITCPNVTQTGAVVGAYMIAQQPGDTNWYRAKITVSKPELNQYQVFFLDYGNQEIVGLENLRPMISYFIRDKCLAMQVELPVELLPDVSTTTVLEDIYTFCDSGNTHMAVWFEKQNGRNYAWMTIGDRSLAHVLVETNKGKLLFEPACKILG